MRPRRCRITSDIDDAVLAEAMEASGLKHEKGGCGRSACGGSVRELRQKNAIADMAGPGWDGDLDAMSESQCISPGFALRAAKQEIRGLWLQASAAWGSRPLHRPEGGESWPSPAITAGVDEKIENRTRGAKLLHSRQDAAHLLRSGSVRSSRSSACSTPPPPPYTAPGRSSGPARASARPRATLMPLRAA